MSRSRSLSGSGESLGVSTVRKSASGRAAGGRNRSQSPPKHTLRAHRKTYCHGGVGINPARGRPPIRLTQLHGSQSASEEGTTSPLFGCAQPSHQHHTPSNHLHQSGQRDSNPRHSAWEADALPTELCPRTFDSLSMGLMLLIAHFRCSRAR